MDKLFSYDQKQTYKQTKEEFDKNVAAKKKSNPGEAVLTLLYVKRDDLSLSQEKTPYQRWDKGLLSILEFVWLYFG